MQSSCPSCTSAPPATSCLVTKPLTGARTDTRWEVEFERVPRNIRWVATMVETAGDVLGTLEAMRGDGLSQPEPGSFGDAGAAAGEPVSDDIRTRILEALGHTPAPVDAIIRDLGLPAQTVLTVLLELELAGRIERQPGNMAALVGQDE